MNRYLNLLMNIKKYIIFIFTLFLLSCNKQQFREEIKSLRNSRIELVLDSMQYARPINEMVSISECQFVYVSYVDSMSCSSCTLSHLSDWYFLTQNINKNVLDYIFIIAPPKDDRKKVFEKVGHDLINGRHVYIDTLGVFERHNHHFPQNKMLHTFLIDKECNVVLIGNPLKNAQIEELLNKIVEGQ